MPHPGPIPDERPWFTVTVTGHPDLIPVDDGWASSPAQWTTFEQAGAVGLRTYLDDALWKKRLTHRVQLYYRGHRGRQVGIDALVWAYGQVRKVPALPMFAQRDVWGARADLYRDLTLLSQSHAVVWFGPRERTDGPDLITLATFLGIPARVVALPDLARDLEREC